MNDTDSSPREYTLDETRDLLMRQFRDLILYWENESRAPTIHEKLEGLVWSILTTLDGNTLPVPCFIVSPYPHPADKEYHKNRGENWFPEGGDLGPLRHYLVKKKEKNNE
jgi:hypothetical protein